ncbi:MBL fold metallo-hydrolase [Shewanella sp. MBTL60-007]|uniref:MBL fold metallo-hydrolase n=1 Tax=Shewanella sp. MBTL60-007 TaxID=2815911 RepID=UPI001BB99549|nr:MBL fold metallo-hydrolase [Shewanella sp. MBTL60-007]GIU16210.1 hypothetical protein TUM3792_09710 [Shewanella sp. MBTL60-007]
MTTKFARRFAIEKLHQSPNWWQELLLRLKPSGEELGNTGLRLAVRDGYLNFYHQGQAIAKVVTNDAGELCSEQHIKYVFENATTQKNTKLVGDDNCILNPENNEDSSLFLGGETLDLWIERSRKHKGEEKTFVEQIVAANNNVIDMEMGLSESGRIDLVTIEQAQGQANLVFWEAKLTTNKGCRKKQGLPEVIQQIAKYRNFLTNKDNRPHIINAYITACKVQTHICELAGKQVSSTIKDVATGTLSLSIDTEPRLLLLHTPKNTQKDSWLPHQQKLIDNHITLQVMTENGDRKLLSSNELNGIWDNAATNNNQQETSVTILRGADTIGGSCIKISHGEHSIVLDYGAPLMDNTGATLNSESLATPSIENGVLLDIQQQDPNPPLAYILSHAHPDHYGLLDNLPRDAKIYLSDSSYSMMSVTNLFYPEPLKFNRLEHCLQFEPGKAFQIGPFTITAFLMDHSAFGACSLLVEVDEKQVFYTGDFRGHGRKSKVSNYLYSRIKQPDLMLIEGTTLDERHLQAFPTEASVEEKLVTLLSQPKRPAFVAASGSNIDRLVSLYNATKRTGKTLVIDLYQLYLLDALKKHAPGLPPHKNDHLKVIFPYSQRKTIEQQLGTDFLKYSQRHINLDKLIGCDYVFRVSNSQMPKFLDVFIEQGLKPQFIYSMWLGYQDKQATFSDMAKQYQIEWQYAHTSGHAYTTHLLEFANTINAKRLVPVHTLCAEKFIDKFSNVQIAQNGEQLFI